MLTRNNDIQVQKKCPVIKYTWQDGQRLNFMGSERQCIV